jgi:hypothetical protein
LLESDEVVDADPGERGDFFSAQTWCASAPAVGQADIARLHPRAVCTEELGQRRHPHSMTQDRAHHPGPAGTRINPAFSTGRRERMMRP